MNNQFNSCFFKYLNGPYTNRRDMVLVNAGGADQGSTHAQQLWDSPIILNFTVRFFSYSGFLLFLLNSSTIVRME